MFGCFTVFTGRTMKCTWWPWHSMGYKGVKCTFTSTILQQIAGEFCRTLIAIGRFDKDIKINDMRLERLEMPWFSVRLLSLESLRRVLAPSCNSHCILAKSMRMKYHPLNRDVRQRFGFMFQHWSVDHHCIANSPIPQMRDRRIQNDGKNHEHAVCY